MFNKHRLEALSDGIFAIAMTLLVLDLKVPQGELPKHFAMLLTEQWIGVVITFFLASVYWTMQHHLFALVDDVHERAIVPTFLFLGLISVLPFSTGLFSQHVGWRSAYIVYFTHSFLIGAALLVKLRMLSHYHKLQPSFAMEKLRMRLNTLCFVMGILAIGSSLVPIHYLSVVTMFAAIAVQLYTRRKKAELQKLYAPVPTDELVPSLNI